MALPDCGGNLLVLSSHQAAHRFGSGGSALLACVQVWRLSAAFDAESAPRRCRPHPPALDGADVVGLAFRVGEAMTQVPTWLLGIHEALQVIWRWSHQDAPALILWRLFY